MANYSDLWDSDFRGRKSQDLKVVRLLKCSKKPSQMHLFPSLMSEHMVEVHEQIHIRRREYESHQNHLR